MDTNLEKSPPHSQHATSCRADEIIDILRNEFYREEFPNFLFFGDNGGLEQIAFDLSKGKPYPIAMIDPIAGAESAVEIASNMTQFVEAIGLEYAERS